MRTVSTQNENTMKTITILFVTTLTLLLSGNVLSDSGAGGTDVLSGVAADAKAGNSAEDETVASKDVVVSTHHASLRAQPRLDKDRHLLTSHIGAPHEPGDERAADTAGKPDFCFASGSDRVCNLESGSMVVNNDRWPSHRFKVKEAIVTRKIKGMFSTTQRSSGKKMESVTVFAAITKLASEDDYPDDANLKSRNVVATTTLTIPVPATLEDVEGTITAKLEPGWYSLSFGTKSFGASSVPRSNSPVRIRMPNCAHDFHEKQDPFYIYRDREVFRDKVGWNPNFVLQGWPTESCFIGFNNVVEGGDLDIGWWVPGNTMGLGLIYSHSGSYEINFQASIYDSACKDEVQSVLLSYTSTDNPSENREHCISWMTNMELFAQGFFRFPQGAFIPSLGPKKLAATAFYGDDCQHFTEVDYNERDIEVAFGYDPSILLLRADNGAEICRFPGTGFNEYLILNLAKLPPQVTIRAKWDMGRGVEGNDQVLPGTSVRFTFSNDFGVPIVDNVAPFTIGGDDNKGTYFDFSDTLRQLIDYGPDPRGVNGLTVEAFQDDSNLYAYESVFVSFSVIEEPLIYRPPACSTAKL